MQKIDYSLIASQTAREYKTRTIMSELQRVGIENVMISDCLVNTDRDGLLVMRTIHEHYKQNRDLQYKIKVLKDKWGKPVKPGDKVEWKFARKVRDPFGRKYTITQIKEFERRGELRQVEIWHSAVVDAKGCITIGFEDAAILLDTRGVYYASGMPITSMPETIENQHFWLYSEVDRESYESLPELTEKKSK